jgi:hypothetical protein
MALGQMDQHPQNYIYASFLMKLPLSLLKSIEQPPKLCKKQKPTSSKNTNYCFIRNPISIPTISLPVRHFQIYSMFGYQSNVRRRILNGPIIGFGEGEMLQQLDQSHFGDHLAHAQTNTVAWTIAKWNVGRFIVVFGGETVWPEGVWVRKVLGIARHAEQ